MNGLANLRLQKPFGNGLRRRLNVRLRTGARRIERRKACTAPESLHPGSASCGTMPGRTLSGGNS